MEKGFELLEQKVRKAADLVKRLQGENKALATQLAEAQSRLKQAARELEAAQKKREPSPEEAKKLEALTGSSRISAASARRSRRGWRASSRFSRPWTDRGESRPRAWGRTAAFVVKSGPWRTSPTSSTSRSSARPTPCGAGADPGHVEKLAAFVDAQMQEVEPVERSRGLGAGRGAGRAQHRRRALPGPRPDRGGREAGAASRAPPRSRRRVVALARELDSVLADYAIICAGSLGFS